MNDLMIKFKKIKIPSEDRIFNVDPTGFAPVSSLAKGRILLHKLRARIHILILTDLKIKQKPLKFRGLCLASGELAIYANTAFWSHYIKHLTFVKN